MAYYLIMKVQNKVTDSTSHHDLDQFLQGHVVNLQTLAVYTMGQIPSDAPPLRRDELLMFIALYTQLTHNAPSHRQISLAFDLSKTTVKNHLIKLERDGRIRVIDGRLTLIGGEYRFPKNLLDKG